MTRLLGQTFGNLQQKKAQFKSIFEIGRVLNEGMYKVVGVNHSKIIEAKDLKTGQTVFIKPDVSQNEINTLSDLSKFSFVPNVID